LATALHDESATPPVLPEVGDVIRTLYAGVHRAASATRDRIDGLHQAAHEDPLTGIANRRGFLAELNALAPERRRGCVALIDIDYFKRVNDLLGHEEGDRVLAAFAERLATLVRRADVVARWGGEEFAIFFQDCIEDEASWSLARIATRMRNDPIGAIQGRPISFSAGISRWTGGPLDEALARADEALYEAKQAGRDRICRAAPALQEA
jgi:diguanylate cyclase (GGDEF)-like protein